MLELIPYEPMYLYTANRVCWHHNILASHQPPPRHNDMVHVVNDESKNTGTRVGVHARL